jgi:hypothetical protein
MDVQVGTAASLRIDFLDPLGMLIPDAGSVTYQVRGTDGSSLGAPAAIATAPTDTGVTVAIPAAVNTISAARRFEKRTVAVYLTVGGRSLTYSRTYRVVPFLNMTASADDVRGVVGLNADELSDEQIDLVGAYFLVVDDPAIVAATLRIGTDALAAALSAGTKVELLANQAIVGQAVMELLSGVPNMAPQTVREGTMQFQRFKPDWAPIIQQARDMRARGIAAIVGLPEAPMTLMVSTVPRDPVTFWRGHVSWP